MVEWEQGGTRRDLFGSKQPLLEVRSTWRAFAIILGVAFTLEKLRPSPSVGAGWRWQAVAALRLRCRHSDTALSREASKAQFHVALGQPESLCDIRHIPPLLQKLCERLIFFEFVHGRARATFSIKEASTASASPSSAVTAQGSNTSSIGTPALPPRGLLQNSVAVRRRSRRRSRGAEPAGAEGHHVRGSMAGCRRHLKPFGFGGR
jgi:hypothetical protein